MNNCTLNLKKNTRKDYSPLIWTEKMSVNQSSIINILIRIIINSWGTPDLQTPLEPLNFVSGPNQSTF